MTGSLPEAVADYTQSVKLAPDFLYSQIQLGVTLYRHGDKEGSRNLFQGLMKDPKWAKKSEVWNYWGEVLMDMGETKEGKFPKVLFPYSSSTLNEFNPFIDITIRALIEMFFFGDKYFNLLFPFLSHSY